MEKVEPKSSKMVTGSSKASTGSHKERKPLPGDEFWKLALLLCHIVGFAVWYGASFLGFSAPVLFPWLAVGSGVLLMLRGLYNNGWLWFVEVQGILTLITVVMTALAFLLKDSAFIFLSVAIVLGACSSHLPDDLRYYAMVGRKG
ncbi:MAG: hypothetical protein NTV33_08320 [Coprothermobacterota bacterium]|nr:hypothetical protein [Coprothermobacterota bacterium]MCX5976813.1 hypothetical protein [Coprothermobacterota bacterium]